MQASTSSLLPILGGQNQYIIPLFQRYYSWRAKNWEGLWEGVTELLDTEVGRRQHFMGPLVFVPAVVNVVAPRVLVIDGQQRLITLSLLLCGIRDVALTRGYEDLAREIEGKFLVDPYHRDAEHLHILPRQRDRAEYIAAVLRRAPPTGMIAKALTFFTERISEFTADKGEEHLRTFLTTMLGGLEFVVITLDTENAFEIFRSLNATGVPLSEADLIRNFVFMNVDSADQIEFDDLHWQALEDTMGPVQTRSEALTAFFRDFLMKDGHYVSPRATYARFEERYSGNDWTAQKLTEELTRYARYQRVLRNVDPAPSATAPQLARLQALDSATTRPLLLNLLNRVDDGSMTDAALAELIDMLSGFILRRLVCRESSRAYSRWFVTICNRLGDSPVDNVRAFLLERRYPSDARFRSAFLRFNLYGSAYAKIILQTLEAALSAGHMEPADLSNATIEHIMPQTLTPEWRDELGSDADRVYSEWLHTPGNLTVTGYNTPLGNKPFAHKRAVFANSNLQMNKALSHFETWNEDAIRIRGEELADLAVRLWPGPADEPVAAEEPELPAYHVPGTALHDSYAEYWETFLNRMRAHGSMLPALAAPDGGHLWINTGVTGVTLRGEIWAQGRAHGVGIVLDIRGPGRYDAYRALLRRQQDLQRQLGCSLGWNGMPKSDRSEVTAYMAHANPGNRSKWSEQHAWLEERLEGIVRVVVPAVSELVGRLDEPGDGEAV